MNINELKATSQAVYKRAAELDHQYFNEATGIGRYYGDLVDEAVNELVPEEWRPVVSLIVQGSCYYSRCEDWFAQVEVA